MYGLQCEMLCTSHALLGESLGAGRPDLCTDRRPSARRRSHIPVTGFSGQDSVVRVPTFRLGYPTEQYQPVVVSRKSLQTGGCSSMMILTHDTRRLNWLLLLQSHRSARFRRSSLNILALGEEQTSIASCDITRMVCRSYWRARPWTGKMP
jgi:hypothetical protein